MSKYKRRVLNSILIKNRVFTISDIIKNQASKLFSTPLLTIASIGYTIRPIPITSSVSFFKSNDITMLFANIKNVHTNVNVKSVTYYVKRFLKLILTSILLSAFLLPSISFASTNPNQSKTDSLETPLETEQFQSTGLKQEEYSHLKTIGWPPLLPKLIMNENPNSLSPADQELLKTGIKAIADNDKCFAFNLAHFSILKSNLKYKDVFYNSKTCTKLKQTYKYKNSNWENIQEEMQNCKKIQNCKYSKLVKCFMETIEAAKNYNYNVKDSFLEDDKETLEALEHYNKKNEEICKNSPLYYFPQSSHY